MSELTIHLSIIKNTADSKAEQKRLGGYAFPVGTILGSVCKETGESCGVVPFIPNTAKTASEQLSEWIDENAVAPLEEALRKGK